MYVFIFGNKAYFASSLEQISSQILHQYNHKTQNHERGIQQENKQVKLLNFTELDCLGFSLQLIFVSCENGIPSQTKLAKHDGWNAFINRWMKIVLFGILPRYYLFQKIGTYRQACNHEGNIPLYGCIPIISEFQLIVSLCSMEHRILIVRELHFISSRF